MQTAETAMQTEISTLATTIATSSTTKTSLLTMRTTARQDYEKALTDDTDAVGLMNNAVAALSSFFKKNESLLQVKQEPKPEYSKKAHEGANYAGRKGETAGVVGILNMLVEDVQKEISEGKADNAAAEADYEKQNAAIEASLEASRTTKAAKENEAAELGEKIASAARFKEGKTDDETAEDSHKTAIDLDCDWVQTSFTKRKESRQDEINGLVDAKDFLSGGIR